MDQDSPQLRGMGAQVRVQHDGSFAYVRRGVNGLPGGARDHSPPIRVEVGAKTDANVLPVGFRQLCFQGLNEPEERAAELGA